MLKKAYIEITNRCNLRCSFCPGTKRVPRTMTPAEFDLVLERLTGQVEYVYLHVMGEPQLRVQQRLAHDVQVQVLPIWPELRSQRAKVLRR